MKPNTFLSILSSLLQPGKYGSPRKGYHRIWLGCRYPFITRVKGQREAKIRVRGKNTTAGIKANTLSTRSQALLAKPKRFLFQL